MPYRQDEIIGIQQQRKLAERLRKQADAPIQAGNAPMSWTQGLAKMLATYGAGKKEKAADERMNAYEIERRKALADAVKGGYGGDEDIQRAMDVYQVDDKLGSALLSGAMKGSQSERSPYYQAVPTAQGYMAFNSRTGQMEPVNVQAGVTTVLPAAQDPNLQAQKTRQVAQAGVLGKEQGTAITDLPTKYDAANESVKLLDELISHPGHDLALGKTRMTGAHMIPGTDAYDFEVRRKQIGGKQFLEAFQSLRGGGQITEVEGAKAEQAIARMDASQTEESFDAAAKEFQEIIKRGLERTKKAATGDFSISESDPLGLR